VCVERCEGVVLVQYVLKLADEFGQVFGRDSTVFEEADVLLVARSAQENREPRLAELPDFLALRGVVGLQSIESEAVRVQVLLLAIGQPVS